MDFAVPADHKVKLKESEKKDKYHVLDREVKKQWNMKLTIMPIVIAAFGTVTEGLVKGLEDIEVRGRAGTIKETALLRSAKILRRLLKTWETCCYSDSSEWSSANPDVKSSQGVQIIMAMILANWIGLRPIIILVMILTNWIGLRRSKFSNKNISKS